MAIVAIFSGPHCGGEDVADGVAQRLGAEQPDVEILESVARIANIEPHEVRGRLLDPPRLRDRFTRERARLVTELRLGLANRLRQSDSQVLHGVWVHLIPESIGHVLRVGLVAKLAHRIATALDRGETDAREVENGIRDEDARLTAWIRRQRDREPFDPDLYDLILPMNDTPLAEAVDLVCHHARGPALATTDASRRALEDFAVAARVHRALVDTGYEVEVDVTDGRARVGLRRYVHLFGRAERKIEAIALKVAGITEVEVVPGTGFVPPSLLPGLDVEPASKILLVDDEVDFVQTLSDRLRTRQLDSRVALDGHEALEVLKTDEPDVMVLDLKMPGIDGIEVLRRVKKDHPGVEVIILTGHGSERERVLSMDLGAFAYLRKPVDIELLTDTLRRAYDRVRLQRGEREDP